MRLLLAALLLVHGAAMGQTFACQYIESGGLNWENGRWRSTLFILPPPFFLRMNGSKLDNKVVADLLGSRGASAELVDCANNTYLQTHSCMDGFGTFLVFDERTGQGGRANLTGSTRTQAKRDATSVAHFICQKM